ncbi:MAG: cytochrome c biogenesis CcdA family protein [Alphaproteobacteria bacterium]
MELIFGYAAGLLTLINPCVLPVLPIVLGSAIQQDSRAPVALATGMAVSFVVLGVSVSAFGALVGLDADLMSEVGALAMIFFGFVLTVPALTHKFESVTSSLSAVGNRQLERNDRRSLIGHFVSGICLGAAWSPCIGPTLGGAISMAAQGNSLIWSTAIMTSFALGTSTVLLILAYGARKTILRRRHKFRQVSQKTKLILSIGLIAVGVAIYFEWIKIFDAWALSIMPIWLQELSVSI